MRQVLPPVLVFNYSFSRTPRCIHTSTHSCNPNPTSPSQYFPIQSGQSFSSQLLQSCINLSFLLLPFSFSFSLCRFHGSVFPNPFPPNAQSLDLPPYQCTSNPIPVPVLNHQAAFWSWVLWVSWVVSVRSYDTVSTPIQVFIYRRLVGL